MFLSHMSEAILGWLTDVPLSQVKLQVNSLQVRLK